MGATKEADLISAVLRYAVRCLADGDPEALRAMNFGPKEIEALREMHLGDLARIESLGAHCLEIGLNRQVYWTMVAHLQRERAAEALQQALVAADAPFEMMQTFFGLSSREYTRLRRVVDVAPPWAGRRRRTRRASRPSGPPGSADRRAVTMSCLQRMPTSTCTARPASGCGPSGP